MNTLEYQGIGKKKTRRPIRDFKYLVYLPFSISLVRSISQNDTVSEIIDGELMKNAQDNIEKLQDFVDQKSNAKSHIQKCIKFLTKEANKNKLDYGQLRYIFRSVRENCDIQVSSENKSLYQLPTSSALDSFYLVIHNPVHKLIFQVLQFTGLRVSELCKLEVSQIYFDENTILIKEGKGKKDRIVPFGNKLKEKLHLYLESNLKYGHGIAVGIVEGHFFTVKLAIKNYRYSGLATLVKKFIQNIFTLMKGC